MTTHATRARIQTGLERHTRAQRFERIRESASEYHCAECIGHDRSRPGGDPTGRWAVLAQGDEGKRLELTRTSSRDRAQLVAESHIEGGWIVLALYDLDELAGEAPRPYEGDVVKFTEDGKTYCTGRERSNTEGVFFVVGSETDTYDGMAYEKLYLSRSEDADYLDGEYDHLIDEQYVEIVTRAEPDERMPVRYEVAGVKVVVAFNTVAS